MQDTNIMITIVTVWLCLITHVACDVVITVNNNGSDNDTCCVNGICLCSSLSSALHNVSDNTVINITSESVTLHDIVGMGSGNLNNITITGNDATIMCNNTGGVYCESCSDITIMGITWYQCGHNDSTALAFINLSSGILIQDCTFQNCPVYIWNATGNILIKDSNFIADDFNFSCSYSTWLYIYYHTKIVMAVNNSRFDGNPCLDIAQCDCSGVEIHSSDDIFEYNQFLFENASFSNYWSGLSLSIVSATIRNPVIELLNINVSNTDRGVYIIMSRGADNHTGIVSILSSTLKNANDSYIQADTVDISSTTILNDGLNWCFIDAYTVNVSSATFAGNYLLMNSPHIVNVSSATFARSYVLIDNVILGTSSIEMSNSFFCNLTDITNIIFTNVTVYNSNSSDVYSAFFINIKNTILSIIFKDVNFMSNYAMHILFISYNHFTHCYPTDLHISIQLTNCTFDNNYASDHVVAFNVISGDEIIFNNNGTIELSDCNFNNNFGGKSIINVDHRSIIHDHELHVLMILDNSALSNNKGTTLYLSTIDELIFKENILFINNSAINGAAVYLEKVHAISLSDNAKVQFINNSAEQKGGAMYINLDVGITQYCNVFQSIPDTSIISFNDNSAKVAGNSIYFSIPQSCQIITDVNDISSLLYYPNKFKYSESPYSQNLPIVTSPYNITLYPPAIAIHNSSNNYLIQESKMLGEPIKIITSVFDYFNNITEPVTFSIDCGACGDEYILSTYLISVHNQSIYEFKIFPTAPKDVINNTNISITFLSALASDYRSINVSLTMTLSSCRAGYLFDNTQKQCACYPHPDLVNCKGYYVEIKIGYWIGYLTEEHYTSSICPNNYCSSEHTETSPGYYSLHGKSDDQCSSHRTGVACGKCKSGYTLAYDSPDCINTDKCSAGMTILVIVLTILYWITIAAVVFGLMYFQFQISSGYAYGIIYYYSIVDILLVNNVSKEVFHLVSILSSFAKLTPQLFGQLCLVEGLSGIDQQFIHYSHALAVSLILLIIVLAARCSVRLTRFVGPCIIRVICLLLLLSYTSLASASLQLLRPLTFNDVDEVRTYSSPDIKYFTGRHLIYGIVAILCEVIIVIGLPLFLLLEPFLRRRVNLVRIKPLLDQFQGCYKDKYRWFAAYYLICRQVIILIVYVGNGNYYYMLYGLQTVCVVIAMNHIWLQPYKNTSLNGLDAMILLILVLVVNLNLFSLFSSFPTDYFSVVLVMLPLLLVCLIAIRKLFKYFFERKKRELHLQHLVGAYDKKDKRNNERR